MKGIIYAIALGMILSLPGTVSASQAATTMAASDQPGQIEAKPRVHYRRASSPQVITNFVGDMAAPGVNPAIGQAGYTKVEFRAAMGESPAPLEFTTPQVTVGFLEGVKALQEYPGQVADMFTVDKGIHQLCSKPNVIPYVDRDVTVDKEYDCIVLFADRVEMQSPSEDRIMLIANGHRIMGPRDATLIIFGDFVDQSFILSAERSGQEGGKACERCSSDQGLTKCEIRDVPFPACFKELFPDIGATVIHGQYYEQTFMCHAYVESGKDIDVTARTCTIKALGPGPAKINANCWVLAEIDAYDLGIEGAMGRHTIFISGDGDAWIEALGGDTVYINDQLNVIFSYNDVASVNVVAPEDKCLFSGSLMK